MLKLDAALTAWTNTWAGHAPMLDTVMIGISTAGVPLLVLAVVSQWWLSRADPAIRHVLIAAGTSFLLGLGINQLILLFVQRARPYEADVTHLIIDRTVDFSFPSDHATASFAIAAAFVVHGLSRRGFGFLAAALLIGLSRVYLGTHYVSDVLGGAMTGFLAAALVRLAYRENTRLDRLITRIF
ncbi:phosphatase PAP2 family protein [Mesorhizobium sp. NZP2077]|uniref:phosphatase PAP2 family protein n=1 Tax=Mesorhizobium sp. NZP2077 TaxID=2483404 RepID=UPI0015540FBF|nr:phosphatase PAP2 family protein [Mesorhizobium sp. NZP2077]QKC80977.1 phosphatase PAP2 family protein [Mesorhizobium sp. NZP2077]QKD14381.1 phosphatase PAP2 family protein [Mesorhizobium sp. NZP2077]